MSNLRVRSSGISLEDSVKVSFNFDPASQSFSLVPLNEKSQNVAQYDGLPLNYRALSAYSPYRLPTRGYHWNLHAFLSWLPIE